MVDDRFGRQELFFGRDGQARIAGTSVCVIGVGGLGTHLVQQLAYLGVRKFTLVDDEELERSNLNRYIGARHDDKITGTRKVDIGDRLIRAVSPDAEVTAVYDSLVSAPAFEAVKHSDIAFGCIDNEGARLVLNELTSAYTKPYFDIATEIVPGDPIIFGGRIVAAIGRPGCIACLDQFDSKEAALDLADENRRLEHARLYGVDAAHLGAAGPSVVTINGVVASLAATEFMAYVTGLRNPMRLLVYHGETGKVNVSKDEPGPCFACSLAGLGVKADTERYLAKGVLPARRSY